MFKETKIQKKTKSQHKDPRITMKKHHKASKCLILINRVNKRTLKDKLKGNKMKLNTKNKWKITIKNRILLLCSKSRHLMLSIIQHSSMIRNPTITSSQLHKQQKMLMKMAADKYKTCKWASTSEFKKDTSKTINIHKI